MSGIFRRWGKAVACGLFVGACAAGCATVTVRKVPTPTQYVRWTDDLQREADNMEGLRFYLPRPFVNVFESFPIRTDVYLANGEVSADGKYVLITSVTSESGLSRYIANEGREVRVPTDFVFSEEAYKAHARGLPSVENVGQILDAFGKLRDKLGKSVPTGVVGPPQPSPPAPPAPPSLPAPETGKNRRSMKNDNGAFAYQPLRGNFDLVYLPDFEEQYVISSAANLGNAMFQVNLGQGWSLQGFDSLVDNSELNKRIFDLIDTSIKLAKQVATGLLGGIPGLASATVSEPGVIRPNSKLALQNQPQIAGTPVTLKIIVVHYAAKGLYPVIKPRELQERMLGPHNSFGVLDLFQLFPKPGFASDYDPTALARAQQAIDNQTGSFTVPRYPYQYVSFNTFRYMAIETVSPTSSEKSPFEHKYHKTGTTGEEGLARTGEIDQLLLALAPFLRPRAAENETDQNVENKPGQKKEEQNNTRKKGEVLQATLKEWEDKLKKENASAIKDIKLESKVDPPMLECALTLIKTASAEDKKNATEAITNFLAAQLKTVEKNDGATVPLNITSQEE